MTKLLAYIISVFFVCLPANAETITVRSGEHKEFTRITMQLPSKATWSINQLGRYLALKVDIPSVHFDVSSVFDRIPRGRLVALTQDNPGSDLFFSLGCSCSFTSFLDSPGFLIIDIKGDFDKAVPRRRALDLPNNQYPYQFSLSMKTDQVPPTNSPKLVFPIFLPQTLIASTPANSTLTANAEHRRPHGAITISEDLLLAQIDRASSQGLIDIKEKPETKNSTMKIQEPLDFPRTPVNLVTSAVPLVLSLSADTSIDRYLAQVSRSNSYSETVPACLSSSQVALHEWAGNKTYSDEIGHWRSQIYSELDTVRPDMALAMARAYLHFGFGAEAALSVDLSSRSSTESYVLKALSQVMDIGGEIEVNPFTGQQKCDGDVALWAVLSENSIAGDVNKNAVKLAFSRLPLHLRSYLGPKLSEKFTNVGESEMTHFILRAIERAEVEIGSGIVLAKAALAAMHGNIGTAKLEWAKSVAAGSEHSPEALMKLVANKYESRETLSPDLTVLTEAYAVEFRNAIIGADLRRTRAVALALAGQFDRAFDTLPDLEERDGYSNMQLALSSLLTLLAERANDVTFLRMALTFSLKRRRDVPEEIGNKMARRLLNLGFTEQAAHWIPASSEALTSSERALMQAEISLARQLPHRAMVELLSLDGVEAARLRAGAMWQEGNYQRAGQMLISAEDFDGAARGFWLADEWSSVPKQAGTRYTKIVAGSVKLRKIHANEAQLMPLAAARVLLQSSYASRAEIVALLQNVTVVPGR